MPAQNRSTPLPYTPGLPPERVEDSVRAIWDEFFRIAQALGQLDRPMAVSVRDDVLITAEVAPAFVRLFDPAVIVWEVPPLQMSTDGIWTCPQEGLYAFEVICEVSPAVVPGTRTYTFELQRTRTFADASPSSVEVLRDTGTDTDYLTVGFPMLLRCLRGDTVFIDARAILSGGSASVNVRSSLQITRVSGVR